jgi:hypothetical protein
MMDGMGRRFRLLCVDLVRTLSPFRYLPPRVDDLWELSRRSRCRREWLINCDCSLI